MWLFSAWWACSGGDGIPAGLGPSWQPPEATHPDDPTGRAPADPVPLLDLAFVECDGRSWKLVVETTGSADRAEVMVATGPDEDAGTPAGGAALAMTKVETGSSLWTRFEARWNFAECSRYQGVFGAAAYAADGSLFGCRWWGPQLDALQLGQLDDGLTEQQELVSDLTRRCPLPDREG